MKHHVEIYSDGEMLRLKHLELHVEPSDEIDVNVYLPQIFNNSVSVQIDFMFIGGKAADLKRLAEAILLQIKASGAVLEGPTNV